MHYHGLGRTHCEGWGIGHSRGRANSQISQTAIWNLRFIDTPFGLHFQDLKLSPSDLKHPYFLSAGSFFIEIEFEDLGASS